MLAGTFLAAACASGGGATGDKGEIILASDFPTSGADRASGRGPEAGTAYAVSLNATIKGFKITHKAYDDAVNGVHDPQKGAQNVTDMCNNAKVLAQTLSENGLRIVSGGTDNHLMLVDVTPMGLVGKEAETLLHAVDLTCNKNLIPYDKNPPSKASGVRLGTAAITTRGLKQEHMRTLGRWIAQVLSKPSDATLQARVRGEVGELARAFPIY